MINRRNWPTTVGYVLAFATFVVAACYGVMYATGYRLNFSTGELAKTGVLAITTRPSGAEVTISGKKNPRLTPIVVRNVLPQEYDIQIRLAGYRDYTQKVLVEPGFATELTALDLVLSEPENHAMERPATRVFPHGNNLLSWDGESKSWWDVTESAVVPVTFDRVPSHVRTALTGATTVEFGVKNPSNNNWAFNLTAAGRKWLTLADPTGFRGLLLGAPLNQATEKDIHFVGEDRMVVTVGTTLYTLDLNSSELTTHNKTTTSFSWWGGQGYIFSKDTTGKPVLTVDNNLFDERPGEPLVLNLPTADEYTILSITDEWWLVQADGEGGTLWMITLPNDEGGLGEQVRIAGEVRGASLDLDKEKIIYATGSNIAEYDLATRTESVLKNFGRDAVTLMGRRANSLFIQTAKTTGVLSPTGENYYELFTTKTDLWLTDESRMVWLLSEDGVRSLVLRKNSPGIFGAIFRPTT